MTQGVSPVYVIASKKGIFDSYKLQNLLRATLLWSIFEKSTVQHLINLMILSWSNLMKLRDVTINSILFDKNEYTMS